MMSFPKEPITRAFRPDRQGAKRHYGSHPYFTKRAWNVVQEYIKHFSAPDDIVLDPFGGSGVTAVESLVLRRKAIYVDISRWACFLARQAAIAPVNLGNLTDAFHRLRARCRERVEDLWRLSEKELISKPVREWYPKGVGLPENSDVRYVEDLFTPRMLHGLATLHAGIAQEQDHATRDLLLLAFSSTLARINRTFLSTTGRQETRGGSAVFSIYRYKVAREPVELPLWDQFAQRFEKLLQAKHETNLLIGGFYRDGDTATFRHGSATRLGEFLKPESVDYIYTDPPYGAHISYLDLSTMWSAWLELEVSDRDRQEEVIEGGTLRKSSGQYQSLLTESIREMARALKKGAWVSLVYAHTDTSYWDAIVQACQEAGLGYCNTVVQPAGVVWSMHKKKNPLRVLSGELVLNFRKQEKIKPMRRSRMPSPEAGPFVTRFCAEQIVNRFGATTEELHHALIPALLEGRLLRRFSKEHGDITPFLEEAFVFDAGGKQWHLPENGCFFGMVDHRALVRYVVKRLFRGPGGQQDSVSETDVLARLRTLGASDTDLSPGIVRCVQTTLSGEDFLGTSQREPQGTLF